MCDVIFVSIENWDEIWRRNQFVCAGLVRRHPELRILFVGLTKNVSYSLRRGRFGDLWRRSTYAAPGFDRITITHPLKLLPDSLVVGRGINEMQFRRHVARVARGLKMRRPVLWLNPHYAVHMVGRMGECGVIYDVTDDWTTFTQSPALTRRIIEQDALLCQKADDVIVCSQRLLEMKRAPGKRVHLIPNGVDAAHYARVLDGAGPLPAMAAEWPRPVFGYTGTVHPDRLDVALVESLANRLTSGSIALVGPNMLPAADVARLRRTGKVFLPGPVPYAEVPEVMRAFDVCVVPHRVSPFTESLNPIKLWEYLAAGKPIVSADVAGFRDFPEWVRLARSANEFLEQMQLALGEGRERMLARRGAARPHSWEQRLDEIEAVLASFSEAAEGRAADAGLI